MHFLSLLRLFYLNCEAQATHRLHSFLLVESAVHRSLAASKVGSCFFHSLNAFQRLLNAAFAVVAGHPANLEYSDAAAGGAALPAVFAVALSFVAETLHKGVCKQPKQQNAARNAKIIGATVAVGVNCGKWLCEPLAWQ